MERERPAGSDGETDHEMTVPPLVVGVTVVIAVPFVNVSELGEYVMVDLSLIHISEPTRPY